MSLSDNEDGDAMARILYSRALVDHGDLVPSTVWLPGHFFFLAIPYFLGIGTEKAAIALTLFVSALTIPITFYLVLDRLGRSAAILAALLLAVYSLHIRFSVMTVAEGPFFTFILLGILLFFSHLKTRSVWSLIAGTSSFNVASSMRFEGWVIPVFLAAAHLTSERRSGKRLISRDLAHMAGFLIGTLAFPLLWSLYCYLQFGDALFFQHQTVADNALYFKNHARSLIYTLAFFPAVALFSMGPMAAPAIIGLLLSLRRTTKSRTLARLALILTIFVVSQQLLGTLITQARYCFTTCSLLLLFAWPGCQALAVRAKTKSLMYWAVLISAGWLLITAVLPSAPLGWFSRAMYSVSPRPRFDPSIVEVDAWLRASGAERGAIAIAKERGKPAAHWLSLADAWYGVQILDRYIPRSQDAHQLYFFESDVELLAVIRSTNCGHAVLGVGTEQYFLSDLPLKSTLYPAFSNASYRVYRWNRGCWSV
jgi:hypothetical protein